MARGICSGCGKDKALTGKGMIWAHGGCEGGGRPPRDGETTPEPEAATAPSQGQDDDFLMGGKRPAKPVEDDEDDWIMDSGVDDAEERLFQNKRYRMPDPVTGIPKTWTRATTMAETISDLYSLNLWRLRMATIGFVRYPHLLEDLRDEFDYLDAREHKDRLNDVAGKAQWLAGSKVSANWGTKMHTQVEGWSRGQISIEEADPAYQKELAVYVAAMEEWDLSPVPDLIERRVALPIYNLAGTLDQAVKIHRSRTIRFSGRTARLKSGQHIIGDVKSGKTLDLAEGEIAIQMAIYAHALKEGRVLVWDPNGYDPKYPTPGAWVWEKIGIPTDSIRTDVGVVMHMPVDRPEGVEAHCTLSWVDLEAGWNAVQLCDQVRDWRRTKGLFTPVSVSEVKDTRPKVRDTSWEERFSAITSKAQGSELRREYIAEHGKDARLGRLTALGLRHLAELLEESA